MPVEIKHHRHHPAQRQNIHHHVEQRGRNETLNRVYVIRHPADQVAGLVAVVIGERQALDVMIKLLAQVMHDPLADPRSEAALSVGSGGPEGRDRQRRYRGEVQYGPFALSERR